MNYSEIKNCDIANGEGVRVTLFVSGCTLHCPGCFNPEAFDFDAGKPFDDAIQDELMEMLSPAYIDGLTLLGGEPFEPQNQRGLLPFLRRLKRELPEKNIWAFCGRLYDVDLQPGGCLHCECTDEILSYVDVLVDGPFVEALANIRLAFCGSENQRVIDLNATRESGEVTLLNMTSRKLL